MDDLQLSSDDVLESRPFTITAASCVKLRFPLQCSGEMALQDGVDPFSAGTSTDHLSLGASGDAVVGSGEAIEQALEAAQHVDKDDGFDDDAFDLEWEAAMQACLNQPSTSDSTVRACMPRTHVRTCVRMCVRACVHLHCAGSRTHARTCARLGRWDCSASHAQVSGERLAG